MKTDQIPKIVDFCNYSKKQSAKRTLLTKLHDSICYHLDSKRKQYQISVT